MEIRRVPRISKIFQRPSSIAISNSEECHTLPSVTSCREEIELVQTWAAVIAS